MIQGSEGSKVGLPIKEIQPQDEIYLPEFINPKLSRKNKPMVTKLMDLRTLFIFAELTVN